MYPEQEELPFADWNKSISSEPVMLAQVDINRLHNSIQAILSV